jgi:putative N6-adenine-specific DNA methylase
LYYAVNTKQECLTFDDLFGQTIGIDRVKYIQPGTPVRVLAKTVNSILTSVPTLQSIAAKAIMTRLTGSRDGVWTPDASVPEIEVMIYLIDNIIYICLNTTGESMHRRGYRTHASQASLKETIAA